MERATERIPDERKALLDRDAIRHVECDFHLKELDVLDFAAHCRAVAERKPPAFVLKHRDLTGRQLLRDVLKCANFHVGRGKERARTACYHKPLNDALNRRHNGWRGWLCR